MTPSMTRRLGTAAFSGAFSTLIATGAAAQGAAPAATAAATPAPAAETVTPAATDAAASPAPASPAPGETAPAETAPPAEPVADDKALEQEANAEALEIKKAEEQAEADALASQLMSTGGDEEEIDAYSLNMYGFVDFVYSYNVKDYGFFNPYSTFAVGRLNLYTAAELGDNWRTLLETRFTYLPNGSVPTQTDLSQPPAPRTDTSTADYVDIDRPVRWGGVVIERAWLEKTYESWLNIRMGHWLTPYGIWNVDHGSPVIIGVRRPFIVGEELFPQSQTGIELHGSIGLDATRVGYHLTLSNGRGPIDKYRDLDSNKALGGRIYATNDSQLLGEITLGASGYVGTYTDRTEVFVLAADGITVDRPVLAEYKESSFAADIKWTKGGFLLQSEAIVNDVAYKDDTRPLAPAGFTPVPGYTPDTRAFGFYGLTGYRFDFLGTMPWVGWEYYDNGVAIAGKSAAFWGGLNFRPTPRVVLKGQYTYSYFPGENPFFKDVHYNAIDLQAAWSF